MDWQPYIESNPALLGGKPCVRGTRLSVELVLELLSNGRTESELLAEYPQLSIEAIRACSAYASHVVAAGTIVDLAS